MTFELHIYTVRTRCRSVLRQNSESLALYPAYSTGESGHDEGNQVKLRGGGGWCLSVLSTPPAENWGFSVSENSIFLLWGTKWFPAKITENLKIFAWGALVHLFYHFFRFSHNECSLEWNWMRNEKICWFGSQSFWTKNIKMYGMWEILVRVEFAKKMKASCPRICPLFDYD